MDMEDSPLGLSTLMHVHKCPLDTAACLMPLLDKSILPDIRLLDDGVCTDPAGQNMPADTLQGWQ